MEITLFKMINKRKKTGLFIKRFLLINFNIDIILRILFFILSNIKINFLKQKLFKITHILIKTIPIIK